MKPLGWMASSSWPAAAMSPRREAARRPFALVVVAIALIDLHHRLDQRIVVAPVGAHARGAGVAGADAVEVLQIGVEHLGVGGAGLLVAVHVAAGQGANAAPGEDHVAVPVGPLDAALVGVGGDEPGRVVVDVHGLLDDPPGVLVAEAVVVVAVAQPIHVGRVLGIAPHVLQRTVAVAMGRVFGVAMELAAGQDDRSCRRTPRGTPAAAGCLAARWDGPA